MIEEKLQIKKIVTALILSLFSFAAVSFFLTTQQSALVGCLVLLVTLWTNEGLALGVVSLLPIVLFPSLGILSTQATTVNYAHPIIYLFLGGFLLAIAVEKTGLHIWIADKVLQFFPNTARGIIFSLAITSGLLSSILSNTTTTLLLITIALYLSEDPKLKLRFALAIAYGASIGGILTPIGTPPNLILLGVMQEKGMETIPFFQWMWMVAPLSIIMFIVVASVLSIGVGRVKIERKIGHQALTKGQKQVLFILGSLMLLLLLNAPIKPYWDGLGMSEPVLLLSAGLLLFAPPFRLLEWMEDKGKIPFRIMMLFGAGFSIAKAFDDTGLADVIASYIVDMTTLAPILLLFAVATIITFTTEITSNTALISIMLPVIYSVAEQTGIDTRLFMMVATLCASYAFMLPIATPPNAIAMSTGVVDVRTMAKYGLFFNVVGIILIVVIAKYFWSGLV
ncbi:MAG: DASS family sodium-coupled anion symporter [Helicobacteraceae bacterium]|jgi:sodium-dependent dicarboxylate transporter 2/3/5|nr:DASS family sodium-coupled anion symporter [Helicobacteraceae bacterium]